MRPKPLRRVYLDTIPVTATENATEHLALPSTVFHYLFRVLRCRDDERIIAFNGDGNDYFGQLQLQGKKDAILRIDDCRPNPNESPLYTILLQGLSKGDRMDIALQKAVELGVNAIYPIQTDYCAVKMDSERQAKKHRHWQGVITAACEQCERAVIPTLQPLQSLPAALSTLDAELKWLLHPYTDKHITIAENHASQPVKRAAVLIGPEGGFSDNEVQTAEAAGFNRIALGSRILRTETATVTALSLLQHLWGDYV